MRPTFADDTRGVTAQIGYVLSAAIAAILISVLIANVTGFVTEAQDDAARQELKVVGQRLSSQIHIADRIISESSSSDVEIETQVPSYVAGEQYSVTISSGPSPADDFLVLESEDGDVRIKVEMRIQTPMREESVLGGEITITFESGEIQLQR